MSSVNCLGKCLLYAFLVVIFVLSGKGYFYAPYVVVEADLESTFSPKILVYYTTNEYENFSVMRMSRGEGDVKNKKISVELPAEKLCKLLIVPYSRVTRTSQGRFSAYGDCMPKGKDWYTLANIRISDCSGKKLKTEEIELVEAGEKKASTLPCCLNDTTSTDTVLYKLKEVQVFSKRFSLFRFVQVAVISLLCSYFVLIAIFYDPLTNSSRMKSLLCAALSAVALSVDFSIMPLFGVSKDVTWLSYLPQFWRNCDFYHLAVTVPFYFLYRKTAALLDEHERRSVSAKVLAIIFSLFVLIGKSYELEGSYKLIVGFDYAQSIKSAFAFCGYVTFSYVMITIAFKMLKKMAESVFSQSRGIGRLRFLGRVANKYCLLLKEKPFLTAFFTLLVYYAPFLIVKFPCAMCYDGYVQAVQIHAIESVNNVCSTDGKSIVLNAHHPIMHTLLIIAFLKVGLWIKNIYVGLCFYSIFQLLLVSAAVAMSIRILVQYAHLQAKYAAVFLAYFLLHPFINDYMFMVTKDVLYAASILLYLSLLFSCLIMQEKKKLSSPKRKKKWSFYILYILSALGIAFLRNEGGVILLISSIAALVVNFNLVKPMLCSIVVAIVSSLFLSGLMQILDIQKGNRREMLSVPCQQLARACRESNDLFEFEEKERLKEIFGNGDIAFWYAPGLSDSVKNLYQEKDENLHNFFSLWSKMLIRIPSTYTDAFLNNYFRYFYPDSQLAISERVDCERTIKLASGYGPSCGERYMRLAQKLIFSYMKARKHLFSFPFLSLPFLAATYTWGCSILLAYAARFSCKNALFLMILPLCLMLLPFLGPTNGDYGRYTYPLMVCLPLVTLAVLRLVKDKLDNNNG